MSYPSSITAPDGTYSIYYEQTPNNAGDVTGRIAKVVMPSGASIQYSYGGTYSYLGITYANGLACPSGHSWVPVLTRTLTDALGNVSIWKYDTTKVSNATVVTDPAGNDAVYTFLGGSALNRGQYDSEKQVYQGSYSSGTLLRTDITCYNGISPASSCITAAPPTVSVTQIDVYTQLAGMSQYLSTETKYDAYGNVIETKDYDFSGTLLRDHVLTYGSYSGATCNSISGVIQGRVCQDIVKDGAGNVGAQTNYTYDAKGNAITISRLTGGTTYLTRSVGYNPNGTVNTSTDVNGGQTMYSTYACNGAFPTSISEPLGLSRSMTWDCNGGVVTSLTDANNKTTTYKYVVNNAADPFWRVLSVTDPLQNITNFTYTPANGGQPATIESALTFGSSISETLKTLDSLGRIHIVQHRQGPSATNYDSVETDYDANGHVSRVTLPYSGAKSATNSTIASTAYTYDALDRPLTVKDPAGATVTLQYTGRDVLRTGGPASSGDGIFSSQLEYDGLGRLISVCEITGGTSAWPGGACGQVQQQAQTGYLTTYAYTPLGQLKTVTQNAQSSATQTRSFSFDGLGRLNSELNSETGQNAPGRTTYTFDSDSSAACAGTFNGDLIKRVDNAGDVTCYAYDALHRMTSITYPSGPKASSTKKKTFVYDTTTFSCPTGANVAGRLAKAYTGSTSVSTGYCYSPRGEITDVYQSTPHSGGYAHFSVSYWANGQLDVLSGFPSSLPNFTYGLDGEGRPKTVSASSGQNPVTATAYNPAQQVTSVTFGSGDNDGYSINSGRMTRYTYNVNGSAVPGALNWNTNGTLKSLGITDPLNSADAQTCTYHYDDLARTSSVNCGMSIWQQNFSYDPFGNITKSVPTGGTGVAWMPGYSTSTNHYTLTGTSYDANGNLTNDTFNTYAWDAEGKMITLNGSITNTFDAFGRIAETGTSTGPWTQFVSLPGGNQVLAMMSTATTLQEAFVPLPGGGQAVYNGSTLAYYRHPDWLGSSRMATTPSRTVYFDGAYAPFGESYATTGTADLMFAGHTQDVIAGGLYDTLNRKHHATQGRWISPDPAGASVVDFTDPQSWNRYAYVGNNPLSAVDPTGLGVGCPGGPSRNPSCDFHAPGEVRELLAKGGLTCVLDGAETPCHFLQGDSILGDTFVTQLRIAFATAGHWQVVDWINSNGDRSSIPVVDWVEDLLASTADVQRILDAFNASVNNMNKNGLRRPGKGLINGFLNNIEYWGTKYEACTGQAQITASDLGTLTNLDDKWTFSTETEHLGMHTVVVGKSSNGSDPTLIMDPWKDTFKACKK